MELIIGGAYQGKLDHAKEKYGLKEEEIFRCTEDGRIDFGAKCIYGIENYTLWCVKNGTDALSVFKAEEARWQDSILIAEDIFCGVVPVEKEMRAWREMTGRLLAYLSGKAVHVFRIFLGLEQKLK